jgi:Flp pilus assembly protein TadG
MSLCAVELPQRRCKWAKGDEGTGVGRTPLRAAMPPCRRCHRATGDEGAVIVEFALLLPVFMMLILGMFTGGVAYNHKLEITNAAREGARYGATVPVAQCNGSACGGQTWAQLVRAIAVERSNGSLEAAKVCVALVSGPGTAPVAVSSNHTTAGGTSPCFVDKSSDTGRRVQVSVQRTDKLEAIAFTTDLKLTSKAVARYEQ